MYPYIPITDTEEREMLKVIGAESADDLFNIIPKKFRLEKEPNLPLSKSEPEVLNILKNLSNLNKNANQMPCFMGAGSYDHYIPTVIDYIASRSEFLTSYTPYQPEISQGTLQYIFEFQTFICRLTGMDVANASLYDVATAFAEAAIMASNVMRKKEIAVSKTCNPDYIKVLKTYCHYQNIKVIEVEAEDGETSLDDLKSKLTKDTAGFIMQSPNFYGILENVKEAASIVHENNKKSSMILSTDPFTLGVLKSPAKQDVDVVIGEAQSLGIPMSFGGPYIGIIAARESYMRKLPGRLVGETVDRNKKRSYVLTLASREQHIRRDKATSNICSNEGINSLICAMYMSLLGKEGMREVAEQAFSKAHYAFDEITKSGKFKALYNKPFFLEFAIKAPVSAEKINEALLKEGILGGVKLPDDPNAILFAVTEKRTKEEIDKLVRVLEAL